MRSTLMLSKPSSRAVAMRSRVSFVRLNAVDGFLDFFLEILDAHGEAIEAHAANGFEVIAWW